MAIDVNSEATAIFLRRYMSVGQMKNCLSQLKDTDLLYPNRVGNLTVLDSSKQGIGYIDFCEEKYETI